MTELLKLINGALIPHTAFEKALGRLRQCYEHAEHTRDPICVGIIGESRTGKSRVLEELMRDATPWRDDERLNIPMLRVTAPSKPSIKALAEVMLRALKDPRWSAQGTETVKTHRILQLMRECGVRMVIIDEFQHFYDKATEKVIYNTCDWLKVLSDESSTALVIAGLPTCEHVIMQNQQLEGRFMAPLRMPRFDWFNPDDREEFCAIVAAYGELLGEHLDFPDLESEEMAFRIYCASGGLIGYTMKLFREMAWDAIESNSKSITLDAMSKAYEQAVWSAKKADGLHSPFARDFLAVPEAQAVAGAKRIGEEKLPTAKPRGRRKEKTERSEVKDA